MRHYAKIEAGKVAAIWLYEAGNQPDGLIDVTDVSGAAVGADWDGSAFTSPPPAPVSLEDWREDAAAYRFAVFRALKLFPSLTHPHMLAEIIAMMGALPDDHDARIAWETVQQFQRNSPEMVTFGAAFGMDAATLDKMFEVAMAIDNRATEAEIAALFEISP